MSCGWRHITAALVWCLWECCVVLGWCWYLYTEILYGSLITVGLVPASTTAADADADADDDKAAAAADAGRAVLRRHPGFTADSVGYNAETGQSVQIDLSHSVSPLIHRSQPQSSLLTRPRLSCHSWKLIMQLGHTQPAFANRT